MHKKDKTCNPLKCKYPNKNMVYVAKLLNKFIKCTKYKKKTKDANKPTNIPLL